MKACRSRRSSIVSACLAALAVPAGTAHAQTNTIVGLEEVVVTAQKRVENIQNVPISISAVTSKDLQREGVQSLQDLSSQVAGLSVATASPGQNSIVIRGVSSPHGDPTVGYYVDETPVSSSQFAPDAVLFDLKRVEVLRGPQGTLYGAGSMGGTVRYITNQPDPTVASHSERFIASATENGGGNFEVDAVVNQPIVSDKAAARIAMFYRNQDGYIDRYRTAPADPLLVEEGAGRKKNINTEETWGARAAIRVELSDTLSVTPSIHYQKMRLGAPYTIDRPPGTFDNPVQSRLMNEASEDEFTIVNLTIQKELGDLTLLSSTSYFDRGLDIVEDASKQSYFFFAPVLQDRVFPTPFSAEFRNRDMTEELRMSYEGDGPWRGVLGLYYQKSQGESRFDFPIGQDYNDAFGSPFGPLPYFYFVDAGGERIDKAAFTEIGFQMTPRLYLAAGVRVFRTTLDSTGTAAGLFAGGPASTSRSNSSDSGTTPKFTASFQYSDDALLYASAARGYRAGGAISPIPNSCAGDLAAIGLATAPRQYDPDSTWNYEVGAKTSWWGGALVANTAVYYIEWEDVQQLVTLPTCGRLFTGNFGTAISKGVDLELGYRPTDRWHVSSSVAYNSAELTDTVAGTDGADGDRLQNAPRWMASAAIEYSLPILGNSAYVRLSHHYVGDQAVSFDQDSRWHERAAYALTNARIGFETDRWALSLFVNNALDKRAETALPLSLAHDLPDTRRVAMNRPRTIGIQLDTSF